MDMPEYTVEYNSHQPLHRTWSRHMTVCTRSHVWVYVGITRWHPGRSTRSCSCPRTRNETNPSARWLKCRSYVFWLFSDSSCVIKTLITVNCTDILLPCWRLAHLPLARLFACWRILEKGNSVSDNTKRWGEDRISDHCRWSSFFFSLTQNVHL